MKLISISVLLLIVGLSTLITAQQGTLAVSVLNNQYAGQYWGYVNPSASTNSITTSSGWSVKIQLEISNATGYTGCSMGSYPLLDPITIYWGDNSQTSIEWNAEQIFINDFNASTGDLGDSFCNTATNWDGGYNYITSPGSSPFANPLAIGDAGGSSMYLWHVYTAVGIYSIYASDNVGEYSTSNTAKIQITGPSQTTISSSNNAFSIVDIGSLVANQGNTISATINCDTGGTCGQGFIYLNGVQVSSSQVTVSSGTSISYTQLASVAGSYIAQAEVTDPVTGIIEFSSELTMLIYPALQNPTLTISQNISGSSNYYSNIPLELNITVPAQVAGSNTESPAYATINWGDGTTTSNVEMSLVGGNYVLSENHTYADTGTQNIQVSLESHNYVAISPNVGTTSSSTLSFTTNSYSLELNTPNPSYSGYNWGYADTTNATDSYNTSNGWSSEVNVSLPDNSCSLIDNITINWGDNTFNNINLSSNSITINGNSIADSGNACGISYQTVTGLSSSQPETAISTTNNKLNISLFHTYATVGLYLINATDNFGSSNVLSVEITNPASIPSITDTNSISAIDLGSSLTISTIGNCGANALCGQQSITNTAGTIYTSSTSLTPASGNNLVYTFTPTQTGVYTFIGNIYNPVNQSTLNSNNTISVIVYPDLQTPNLNVNPSAGQVFYQGIPVDLSLSIPEQIVGSNLEAPPYATINWGDGTIISNAEMSINNGYYVYSTNHTYNLTGSENIVVNVYSSIYNTTGAPYGSKTIIADNIGISAYVLPTVAISLPTTNVCNQNGIYTTYPGTYAFSLTANSFPIQEFSINWGDSQITTMNNPSNIITQEHTYSSSGTYLIIGTATDTENKSSSSQVNVQVSPFLNPSISSGINPKNVTATQQNEFQVSVTQGTCSLNQIIWAWGDGSLNSDLNAVSGENNAQHTYQITQGLTTQTYPIQVSVTDTLGNVVKESTPINVNYVYPTISGVTPTVIYNTPAQSTYSNNFNVTISGGTNQVSGSNVQWDFGDNTANQTGFNQTHTYANPGNYTITITAQDSDGYYTVNTTNISVLNYPTPIINQFTLPAEIYQGISANYSVNIAEASGGFNISSIIWNWGDNTTSTQQNPNYGNMTSSHTYYNAGTYTLSVRVIDINNAQAVNSTTVVVNPYIAPKISNYSEEFANYVNPSNTTISLLSNNYAVDISAGSYNVTQITFNWGDGTQTVINQSITSMSEIEASHAYPSANTYTLSIFATDSNGKSASYTTNINVLPYVNPTIVSLSPTNVIVNASVNYTATFSEGSVPLNYTIINFDGVNKTVNTTQVNGLSPYGGSVSIPFKFTNAGLTPINVSVYDILGNNSSNIFNINVQSLPLITAFYNNSYNSGELYSGLNTSFTINMSEGTNAIEDLVFNFGDGTYQNVNLSTYASPMSIILNHTYSQGTYIANFTVFDSANNSEVSNNDIITITAYKIPQINNISPLTVSDDVPESFSFNITSGYFNVSNVSISWGDNSTTIINDSSNSNLVTTNHTYPFAPTANYTLNATVCDINGHCSTNSTNILTTYNLPIINSVSPTTVYADLNNTFIFNISKGTFNVSSMNIFWGDKLISQININSTSPSISHIYSNAGTYTLQAFAIDSNQQSSQQFNQVITVSPYIPPIVSKLTPNSVTSGVNTTFSFVVTQGILPLGNLTINWGNGLINNYSVVNGTNQINFNYTQNGTFTAIETIYDSANVANQNNTIIQATQYPWNFSTPQSVINFTISNNSTAQLVQLSENDILAVNYSILALNVVPDYTCSAQISQTGLFSVLCNINQDVLNLNPETAYYSITATDSDGIVKTIIEQVNINSTLSPSVLTYPYNINQSIQPPSPVYQKFVPVNAFDISLILVVALIGVIVGITIFVKRKKNNEYDDEVYEEIE